MTSLQQKRSFRIGDCVVYPSHGVGLISDEEAQIVAGMEVRFLVIAFEKDKMTLRVPINRAEKAGLRHLSSSEDLEHAMVTLQGKPKIEKGMWSKRAQKYEEKIYSGSVVGIAEVLRDLHHNVGDPTRSYSERMLYEAAFERFINEYAVTHGLSHDEAKTVVGQALDHNKVQDGEAA